MVFENDVKVDKMMVKGSLSNPNFATNWPHSKCSLSNHRCRLCCWDSTLSSEFSQTAESIFHQRSVREWIRRILKPYDLRTLLKSIQDWHMHACSGDGDFVNRKASFGGALVGLALGLM